MLLHVGKCRLFGWCRQGRHTNSSSVHCLRVCTGVELWGLVRAAATQDLVGVRSYDIQETRKHHNVSLRWEAILDSAINRQSWNGLAWAGPVHWSHRIVVSTFQSGEAEDSQDRTIWKVRSIIKCAWKRTVSSNWEEFLRGAIITLTAQQGSGESWLFNSH